MLFLQGSTGPPERGTPLRSPRRYGLHQAGDPPVPGGAEAVTSVIATFPASGAVLSGARGSTSDSPRSGGPSAITSPTPVSCGRL